LDLIAQTLAAAAISDAEYLRGTCEKIISTREKTIRELQKLNYNVLPSQANFIFMQAQNASALYEFLFKNKILARHWKIPKIENYLRVSIGTDEEMEEFITCVKAF
jgi:histidinol-phosphate aminotransferase